MGKASKEKGKRGELELAAHLREYGYECKRGQQFCGLEGNADVVGLPGIHIECKRVEKLNLLDAVKQAVRDCSAIDSVDGKKPKLPAVFHRKNREEWLVTMRLDDFIQIYREYESANDLM